MSSVLIGSAQTVAQVGMKMIHSCKDIEPSRQKKKSPKAYLVI